MATQITHDEPAQRFHIHVDDQDAGVLEYQDTGGGWVFTHTEVKPEFTGRGLAGMLAGHALREAVSKGKDIKPVCPFVVAYVKKHPEFQDHVVED
ncbi:MAG TPA: GNAT family N-acetyltransferase [Beutenbergiaceae bacterium]|nr:GNAT family N-acetyltransferase [Beutenbergiaceae bacterium]